MLVLFDPKFGAGLAFFLEVLKIIVELWQTEKWIRR